MNKRQALLDAFECLMKAADEVRDELYEDGGDVAYALALVERTVDTLCEMQDIE